MSSLNSLFNRAGLGVRCKTCLNLAISRMKLLRNKREAQLKQMQKEISQYLQTGQEAIARIRVEHIIREQNILAAYEILELFCEFVLARVPILEAQRNCPSELQEAVSSILFASPRCSDLPELLQIRNLFAAKYGKEFVSAASDLRPDSGVNRTIIEKLSIKAPPPHVRLKVLKAIAKEYNIEWDSSSTEAEFAKKHEDLLDGPKPSNADLGGNNDKKDALKLTNDLTSLTVAEQHEPPFRVPDAQVPVINTNPVIRSSSPMLISNVKREDSISTTDPNIGTDPNAFRSSEALERARAALSAAERASAAARAAAELVNVRPARGATDCGNYI